MVRGKRGSVTGVFEVIISLLLAGLFIYSLLNFILAHTSGEEYFGKFYAVDLSTSAQLVNAGYGDVVLRYDNLKPNLDLAFWFDAGSIAVGTPALGQASADTRFYGIPRAYPEGPTMLTQPTFLVLRKNSGNFAISSIESKLKSCPLVPKRAVDAGSAVLQLDVVSPLKDDEKQLRVHVQQLLEGTPVKLGNNSNIHITIIRKTGEENRIEFSTTSPDGASFDCFFLQQLKAITTYEIAANEPQTIENAFVTTITITAKDPLPNEQLGQAIVNALAVYFR